MAEAADFRGTYGISGDMSRTSYAWREPRTAGQLLAERFRCPLGTIECGIGDSRHGSAYFKLGSNGACCLPRSEAILAASVNPPPHMPRQALANLPAGLLGCDAEQIIDNLRLERYSTDGTGFKRVLWRRKMLQTMYSMVRPFLLSPARRHLQRLYFRGWEKISFPHWPVDTTVENLYAELLALWMKTLGVDRIPFVWFWPDGALSCTVVTHDVETSAGRDHCAQLMDLNDSFGIKSSFQIVPEGRYAVPQSLLECIRRRGFEVNIHDLNHDGRLVSDREEFLRRAKRINRYAREYHAGGFRSAVMYRNLDWYDALEVSYDMSVPNVAHLDPQPGGCCTVLPFSVGKILELPLTTTQDYTLFHILKDYSIRLWKEQISLIRRENGLVSFLIHPDYVIHASGRKVYAELLEYLSRLRSEGQTWMALPNEVNRWWRFRQEMSLCKNGGTWRILGKGSERARLAYAVLENESIRYELQPE